MFRSSRNVVCAVEFGTSKVCVLIGEVGSQGEVAELLGQGMCYAPGAVIKGEIADVGRASAALSKALEDADRNSGGELVNCPLLTMLVSGCGIESRQATGIVTVKNPDGIITEAEKQEANENAKVIALGVGREIINTSIATNRHPKFTKDFPAGLKFYQIEDVEKAIDGSDMIIGGVSSFGVEWFGDVILPLIPESIPVLTVTKGLMDTPEGKLLTYPDLWRAKAEKLGKKLSLNAVGGPCTSYELVAHDQTEVAFCGDDMETLAKLKAIMQTEYYHISITTDVVGIESAVALKNGYALGIALTIGLNQKEFGIDSELHFNSQAAIFGQAVEEMYKLLDFQGALTLKNLKVGLGDLYVTVYGGRTRLVGILLGRGLNIDEAKAELNGVTLESLVVAERVARAILVSAEKGVVDTKDFPLLLHINDVLTKKASAELPWEKFTFVQE